MRLKFLQLVAIVLIKEIMLIKYELQLKLWDRFWLYRLIEDESELWSSFKVYQRYNKYVETILHVLDIQSMILAQRVMVLKRFTNKDNNSSWKIILNYFLSQVGGEFILKCHFDTRQLPIYLPAFYKECLDAWSMLRQPSILSYEDVVHQVIWNDKNITVQKLSLFEKHLLSKGIVTIGNLISDTGIFLKGVKVLHTNLSPILTTF